MQPRVFESAHLHLSKYTDVFGEKVNSLCSFVVAVESRTNVLRNERFLF